MAKDNHSEDLILSAVDFLRLAEDRCVARVDLAEVGRKGILFVRELTAAEKSDVLPRPRGKGRVYKDQSIEVDWSQLSPDAAAKFLKTCLVTDKSGGKELAAHFGSNGETADTVMVQADLLTPVFAELTAQLGKPHLAMEKLEAMPNAVVDLLIKKIRHISGLDSDTADEDELEAEKKG